MVTERLLEAPVRRAAVFELRADVLLAMFTTGEKRYRIREGLPDDARVLGARYDAIRDLWEIGIESATLDEVEISTALPRIAPIVVEVLTDHRDD